jgi:hypothetical protein
MTNPWKVGDKVRFVNQKKGEALMGFTSYTVTGFEFVSGQTLLELAELPGQFGLHIFVAADYPDDSIVPRPPR